MHCEYQFMSKLNTRWPSSRAVAEGDVRLVASLKTLLLLYMIISIWTIKVFNDLNKKHKSRVILHQNKCESWGGGGFFLFKERYGWTMFTEHYVLSQNICLTILNSLFHWHFIQNNLATWQVKKDFKGRKLLRY